MNGKQGDDIEDLMAHPCRQDCSVPPTSTAASQLDDEWSIPAQRGVDNSAYTWRRDRQMGRVVDNNGGIWWMAAATLAAVSGILFASRSIAV